MQAMKTLGIAFIAPYGGLKIIDNVHIEIPTL